MALRSSINKFNKNKPSIAKLQQIADFLGVTVDCLSTTYEFPGNEIELTARDKRDIAKDLDHIMGEIQEMGMMAHFTTMVSKLIMHH